MKQEDKELVLKDLSARLPYGVVVNYKENEYDIRHWKIDSLHTPAYSESGILIDTDYEGWISFTEYKGCGMSTGSRPLHIEKNLPFLRSMSSMTEEERKEFHSIWTGSIRGDIVAKIDFYLKHHFDFRLTPEGLSMIEAGLALEAPEGMYGKEE